MKNYIIIYLIIISGNLVNAQHCSENINTPLGTTQNVWDWTQQNYTFWVKDEFNSAVEITEESPFFTDDQNDNIFHLNDAVIKDFHPEDGWELVFRKFGTDMNPVEPPVFILYNRYLGLLRSFVWTRQFIAGYSQAELVLNFIAPPGIYKESGILNLVNNPTFSLDNFEKELKMTTPNSYSNSQGGGFWLYSDIPVAYDPCTCEHQTALSINANLINVTTFDLNMQGGGNIEQIVSGGSNNGSSNTNSLRKVVDGATANGTKVSKTLGGFVTTANAINSAINLKFREDGQVKNWNQLNGAERAKFNKNTKERLALPEWVNQIPKIGFLLGVAEFFINGGKSTAPPTPMSFEASLEFDISGTGSSIHQFGGIDVYTPGAIYGGNDGRLPVYDNILGVFTLLRTPVIKRELVSEEFPYPLPGDPHNTEVEETWKFQLRNPLEFAVNPASGLKLIDVKAALVFGTCSQDAFALDQNISSFVYEFTDTLGNKRWQTPFYPASCIEDIVIQSGVFPFGGPPEICYGVTLKLLSTLERDESDPFYDPDAEKVNFMVEYNTNIENATGLDSGNQHDRIPLSTTVSDLSLTEDMTIYAWSTIELGSDIQTNGHQLTLVAGSEIIGDNLDDVPSDIDLIIGYPSLCEEQLPAQTPQQVADFCVSGDYDPVVPLLASPDKETSSMANNSGDSLNLSVSPNPFGELLNVTFETQDQENIVLIIYDALGRQIELINEEVPMGIHEWHINTSSYGTGFYVLTVKKGAVFEALKLVKKSR